MSVRLKNIKKEFSYQNKVILNGLNLQLEYGDFCLLLGSNGSGKSTLLKVISGEHSVSDGLIEMDGIDVTNLGISKRSNYVGEVTQNIEIGVVKELTLLENFTLSFLKGKNARLGKYNRFKDKVIDILSYFNMGLEQYIDLPLSALSGGQRQIVSIAMVMNSSARIVLLDEHTSALDAHMHNIVMNYTNEIAIKNNLIIIMVTHKLEDFLKYGNRVIFLSKGKIVKDLKGEEKKALTIDSLQGYLSNEVLKV